MKKNVLIIGAGGVGQVAAHKCAQHNALLGDIHIASRNIKKCLAIIDSIHEKGSLQNPRGVLKAHQLDAMDTAAAQRLIEQTGSQIVINLGHAFVNMSVLEACIATGAAYIDTAIHEDADKICEAPPWYANHEWKRKGRCAEQGVTAILGCGFDPGVVNAYAALAVQEYFDKVDSIDIIDINAGSHGRYFATNFNPEINFREFTGQVWSWQDGQWKSNRMFEVQRTDELPVVGTQTAYLTGHDELHSLSQHLDVPNIRFWMGFGEHYINVFNVLRNIGLLSEKPVRLDNGQEVVPLQLVKAVLPDPASLAPGYVGKTCIGNLVKGSQNGQPREIFIYNVADHVEAFAEVGSQGISYTAGVPAAAAALLIAQGTWDVRRMVNVEELPCQPFINLMNRMGLPTHIREAGREDMLLGWDEPETEAAQA
ncbi:saccharopine dehydrogenase family protein [Corticibacter populi]|uniref:Saccharopine dehydrogenase family protein n=1 Tax=Corticibacter populi TaxID=1550736 RepID=A0A3M6QRX2_9BURK|nr:saccharopine dehydrogenase family protein [Corticibacter populi]RMX05786.1 saccharopine dehydrogenase family protein [Corticibacter populi]RZS30906.1 carboxynorspermidine dehydrogenase [Corticibacter populi]